MWIAQLLKKIIRKKENADQPNTAAGKTTIININIITQIQDETTHEPRQRN